MLAGCERKEDGTWWFRMGAASKCESKDFPRVSDGNRNRVGIKRRVRVEKAVLGGVEEREKGQKDGEEGSRKERWRGGKSGREWAYRHGLVTYFCPGNVWLRAVSVWKHGRGLPKKHDVPLDLAEGSWFGDSGRLA
jgi:hypothetical protein